ncbi:FAD/NAD(P)-binding protein [Falsirhodobacter algicola]|uniref:NAD(P)-binding protein n=1 Tax=Falsirhodobacter algicola TaxID=2692330 RepID=A0A8J8MTE5_9RHOB|nr:FAD/NAD(P)-binding protein [Falsirhodobacter algicola]QUS36335.1 NAD(P)-binding protein [Falsirhodobacter algicola]
MPDDPPCPSAPRHVLIIGGGASGVIMAAHVLMRPGTRVTLIERGARTGCGIAYATTDPNHLLNTRAQGMSAFADRPDDFLDWLHREGRAVCPDAFADRASYGRYLGQVLAPWDGTARLTILQAEVTALEPCPHGIIAHLPGHPALRADRAILATGHAVPEAGPDLDGAWSFGADMEAAGDVVIVGSGLSMVDQVLSLLAAGHRGTIIAVSRRGRLPLPHAAAGARPPPAHPPIGAEVSALLQWARAFARRIEAEGGRWQDAVDAIRPQAQRIWQGMSEAQRRRFLRHAATWWGVHRHRIPPASASLLQGALDRGQLVIQRAAFEGTEREGADRIARIRHAGGQSRRIRAARIIDCRGILRDPETHGSALIRDLLRRGTARMDPLRIGLSVDAASRLIGADGQAAERILALGPVARAAFWEITAVPDIRDQAARLAAVLEAQDQGTAPSFGPA